jgi:hypothetical protein
VRRGAGIAAAAGSALALVGAAASALPDADPAAGTSALTLAADRGATPAVRSIVPVPVASTGVPGIAALAAPSAENGTDTPTSVLDPAKLSRAVARAQQEARRLADESRGREADRAAAARKARAAEDEDDDEARATAERARRAGRAADPDPEPAARAGEAPGCGLATGGLGAVRSHVRTAADVLGCAFGQPTVLGIAGRGGPSDHPKGLALDFMVDRATGDALAACAVENRDALGISYVIWRQRIDTGSGFRPMADRGGATANHFDHVHVSFRSGGGTGAPVSC